jgi:hypothetical protein
MEGEGKIYESQIYDIWKNKLFTKELSSLNDKKIKILDVGEQNEDEGGPDFKNARIQIGNLTFVGDVEIDIHHSDWKSHGHHIDKKYNKVILHASLFNKHEQPYVFSKEGRKVPSILLSEFVSDSLLEKLKEDDHQENDHQFNLVCASSNHEVSSKVKDEFIKSLGIQRLRKKCDKIYHRLKELAYLQHLHAKEPVVRYDLSPDFRNKEFNHEDFNDKEIWQQLLYELIFEALGYSKNKVIMYKLAQSANIDFVKKISGDKDTLNRIESLLFNVAGLAPDADNLPDESLSDYSKMIDEKWKNLKRIYDGKTYDETDWHFFRLRPQNFPTIRIAAGARFADEIVSNNLIGVVVKKIKEIRSLTVLIKSLRSLFVIKSEGFWKSHYVFDKDSNTDIKYFVGVSRADEILTNVIFPYFTLYFEIFGQEEFSKKILKTYSIFWTKADNRIVKDVASSLNLEDQLKKTIYQQGMIELFRSYCSKNRCLECEIGKEVFN